MKMGCVKIAGLIALIALSALAIVVMTLSGLAMVAVKLPSPLIAQLSVTFALTCLLIATLAAIVSANRAPAIGFALFGWGYVCLVFGPGFSDHVAPWLVSSRMLDEVYFRVDGVGGPFAGGGLASLNQGALEGQEAAKLMGGRGEPQFLQFRMIGHSLFAIAHGIFGGLMAMALTRVRRPKSEARP